MSDIQLEQINRIYAPPFSGIAIDKNGFKYVVTNSDDAEKMVYRFNLNGTDVLREMGNFPVEGDTPVFTEEGLQRSEFVSIAVNDFGTYAVLDKSEGRIFVYNFDGEMLFAFGSLGEETGQLSNPSGIAWDGDKLIVTDEEYKMVIIYKPTEFGDKVLRATEAYYNGEFDLAGNLWNEVAELNTNYEIAYVGIGKKLLIEQEYKSAMEYFKLGYNRLYYSKAYEDYRNEQLEENFVLYISPIVFLMGYIIYTEVRYSRKVGE
jgi:DNA-binding beta-propeller fold protein YncE